MKKIPIEEASNKQLLTYCQIVLGLEDAKAGTPTARLLAKIDSVQPGTKEILVEDEPVAAPAAPQPQVYGERSAEPEPERAEFLNTDYRSERKVRIRIPNQPGPGGERAVPVAVEGVTFLIKREEDVEVPMRVWYALSKAVEKHYAHVPSKIPGERPDVVERDVQSYPFMAYDPPSEAELRAWEKSHEVDPAITAALLEERKRRLALQVQG
jgi:hypothetical protein